MAILEVKDIEVNYGLINAIKGISFHIEEGEIVALIGANGAGKSTIMRSISGLLPLAKGEIVYNGEIISNKKPSDIVKMGLSQVPEGRRIFQELTVKDNLMLGAYTRKNKKEIKNSLENVYLKFPILKERSKQIAGTLSGGEQQMLAMGRALMAKPRLLIMDEPSMGLSPLYVNNIFKTIKEISEQGTTILLVEQNAKKSLQICNRAYVLENGVISYTGTSEELLNDDRIKAAYLGDK